MMAVQLGHEALQKVCEALGLYSRPVKRILLDIPVDGIVSIYTDENIDETQFNSFLDILKNECRQHPEGSVDTTSQLNKKWRTHEPKGLPGVPLIVNNGDHLIWSQGFSDYKRDGFTLVKCLYESPCGEKAIRTVLWFRSHHDEIEEGKKNVFVWKSFEFVRSEDLNIPDDTCLEELCTNVVERDFCKYWDLPYDDSRNLKNV